MGYEIHYGKRERRRLPWLTAGAFAAFLVLVFACWPRGWEVLAETLFPGDRQVTVRALGLLAGKLRSGEGILEAVEAFCGYVLAAG